ncbi:hypothetical protein C0992_002189 [Termitomyces sp. T32_za158]|nr:hypothetical protein C0992_002189 [Termitomyces sp. T32_za158]
MGKAIPISGGRLRRSVVSGLSSQPISQVITRSLVIAHTTIDLLLAATQSPSANTSPSTPSSPSPHLSVRNQYDKQQNLLQAVTSPYNSDQLIRLKISMRETEHPQRQRQPLGNADPSALYGGDDVNLLGRNEGTVRFLFGPPGVVTSV